MQPAEIVVVIDVIRAFTTAAVLAARGATEIICVGDTDHAPDSEGCYVAWDQSQPQLPAASLPNSPSAALCANVAGRAVTLRTLNGTPAATKASSNCVVVTGAVVNAEATSQWIQRNHPDVPVRLVVSDELSPDDHVCADLFATLLRGGQPDRAAVRAGVIAAIGVHGERWREHVSGREWRRFVNDVYLCAESDVIPVVLHGRQATSSVRFLPVTSVAMLGGAG